MSWDRSKENIQPLRQGRRVEALYSSEDAQSISKTKQDYLDKMNSALELDDPLDPYIKYMKWYRSVNPNLGNEYYHILKDCLHFFKDNNLYRRYSGDQRFVGIWLEYADQYRDPQSIYEYMNSSDIGATLAVFYEYWSRSLEVKGDYAQAEVILSEGVKQFAHPVRRLEKLLLELKSRIPDNSLELSSSSQHDRSVLGQLASHRGKVDSVRAGAYKSSVSGATQQQESHTKQTDNFVVYRGPGSTVSQSAAPLSQPNTAIPTREKLSQENTQPTSKWIKASIPSAPSGRPVPPVDFLIHVDPNVPLSTPVSVDEVPKHILKERPQAPESDPLEDLDMRPSARRPRPPETLMYPYWEVYPYAVDTEFALEELRTRFERYTVEIDTETDNQGTDDMELTCMEPHKKISWDDPNLQKRVSPLQRTMSNIVKPTDFSKPIYSQPMPKKFDTQERFSSEPARTTPTVRKGMGPVVHTPIQSYLDYRSPPQVYMSKYLVGQDSASLSKSRSYEDNIVNLSRGQGAYQSKSPSIDMVSEWKRGVSEEKKLPRALPDKFGLDTDRKIPISHTYSGEMKVRNVKNENYLPSEMYKSKDYPILQPPQAKQQQQQQQQLSEFQEDTMTVRSKKADAEILELFATTLPSEKDEVVNSIETVKVKKQIDFKFFEIEKKESDLSSMLPPPPSTLTYRTPAKGNISKFPPDSSIDSSLFIQPTSTPMVGRNIPLSVQDITEIQNQEKNSPVDPITLQFSQISTEENKENPSVVSAKETSSSISLEQRNEYERTTKYLSPINEENSSSQENSSGKSLEETVAVINPFNSQTIKKMVNEYLSQNSYERLIDCTAYPAPTFVIKKTAMFGNVHFKILEHIGTGGFANVYLASPMTSEAKKLSPTHNPALKVVMKQPTCIEYLISSKIHERLSLIKKPQLSASFYQPYSCVMYKNSTILVSEYYPHGTLLDLINELKISRRMEETISIQLTLEITNLVHTLHSIGIVHNDIKPDNFLLRYSNPITGGGIRKELAGNLLHLIDFGRSVDLSMFPKNVQFVGSSDTDTFELPCMKTNKPYLYNCDSFGLAATLYCIITFEYPRIIPDSDNSNKVKLVRPIKSACRHYSAIWDSIIYKLMNAGSYEAMETIVEVRNEISDCITVSTLTSKWM